MFVPNTDLFEVHEPTLEQNVPLFVDDDDYVNHDVGKVEVTSFQVQIMVNPNDKVYSAVSDEILSSEEVSNLVCTHHILVTKNNDTFHVDGISINGTFHVHLNNVVAKKNQVVSIN